jgi:hypothetical protein
MALHANVIGLGIARAVEAEKCVNEIGEPAYEQNYHEQVNVDNQIINVLAMFGGENRQSYKFFHEFGN